MLAHIYIVIVEVLVTTQSRWINIFEDGQTQALKPQFNCGYSEDILFVLYCRGPVETGFSVDNALDPP